MSEKPIVDVTEEIANVGISHPFYSDLISNMMNTGI